MVQAIGSLPKDVYATLAFLNTWQLDVFLPQCKPHHYIAAAIAGRCGRPWGLILHCVDPGYWATASSLPPLRNGGKTICGSQHIQAQLAQHGCES